MRELSVVSLVQVTVCWFVELILVPNFQHSNKEKNHFQSVKQTSNSSTAEQTRVYTHICLPFFNPNSYIYINKCCVHITSSLHKLTKIFILVLPKRQIKYPFTTTSLLQIKSEICFCIIYSLYWTLSWLSHTRRPSSWFWWPSSQFWLCLLN